MPTKTNYQWSSVSAHSLESVTIPGPHDVNKPYFIGVYGETDCVFSIIAGTTNVVQRIQAGVPVRGSVAQGTIQYYIIQQ